MALFGKNKDKQNITKEAKWKWGLYPAIVEVSDNHIHLKGVAQEVNIYYKDIQQIERRGNAIIIKGFSDKYQLTPKRLRGGKDLADGLYAELTEKLHQHNNQVPSEVGNESPSFCGNCGQALNGENFCPSCGAEVKKI